MGSRDQRLTPSLFLPKLRSQRHSAKTARQELNPARQLRPKPVDGIRCGITSSTQNETRPFEMAFAASNGRTILTATLSPCAQRTGLLLFPQCVRNADGSPRRRRKTQSRSRPRTPAELSGREQKASDPRGPATIGRGQETSTTAAGGSTKVESPAIFARIPATRSSCKAESPDKTRSVHERKARFS